MRTSIKHAIERALVHSGVATVSRARRRSGLLILAYHDIVPRGRRATGESSLHLSEDEFARQIDALVHTHDVVTLESILESGPRSPRRPRVVITFDDAYAGALDAGIPNLVRRGLPATIFVAPGLLGRTTWWDELATRGGELSTSTRDHALHQLHGDGNAVMHWAETAVPPIASRQGATATIATLESVQATARKAGITIGSHSWSHANLASLDGDALEREIHAPIAWLRQRVESYIPWLAYPYGLYSRAVASAAAAAGYAGALRVDGGWAMERDREHPLAIPRYNVPAGLSLDGFRLRLAGIGAG